MEGYLGEAEVNISETPVKDYGPAEWAIYLIEKWGAIDGAHHKDWVLDQAARALHDTVPLIRLARWRNGHEEYRVDFGNPSPRYLAWVAYLKDGEDGPETYSYDEGIAP